MKIACLPDLHCYWGTYEKNSKGSLPSRLQEWNETTEEVIDILQTYRPRSTFAPGDFFRDSRPTPEMQTLVMNFFNKIRCRSPLIGCCGNHDFIAPGVINAADVVGWEDRNNALTGIKLVNLQDNLALIVVPFGCLDDNIYDVLDELKHKNPSKEHILLSHYATDRSIYVNGTKASEPGYSIDMLKALNFKACVLGHIHKQQILSTKPLIFHTGTLTRGKLDEGEIPCGVTMLDTETWTTELIELHSPRKIITLKLENPFVQQEFDSAKINGQIVVVKYEVEAELASQVDLGKLKKDLTEAGAFFVADIRPTIIGKEREKTTDVTESISDTEKFTKWITENMGVEPNQYLIDVFEGLMKTAKEN